MPAGRPPSLITQADLEDTYDPTQVLEVFDRQRKGQPDPQKLRKAMAQASAIVQGMCLPGFGLEQVVQMAAQDEYVKLLCCQMVMGLGSLGTPGLRDADGKNGYISDWRGAQKELEKIVKAQGARFSSEETVARNANLGPRLRPTPRSVFASTTRNPSPGGF